MLASIRRRQLPVARALVAIFAAGWLALAMQPCAAMAQDPGGHDSGMAGHHEDHGGTGHQCPHCPPAPADDEGCGTGTALYCESAGIPGPVAKSVDQPRLESWVPIDLPAGPLLAPGPKQSGAPSLAAIPWRPPSASIQQRFCSFLK